MKVSTGLRLRIVTENDLAWLAEMACDPELVGVHNWAGEPRDPVQVAEQLRNQLRSGVLQGRYTGMLVVEHPDGTPMGDVSWRPIQWGPSLQSRCPSFGIALKPQFRGQGFGTTAQRLLIDFLFERDSELQRIQSDTAVDNIAETRSLARVGMVQEGVIRSAEFRAGHFHDHYLFSILRSEWSPQNRGG